MDDGMQWLAGTILSAVISSVITVGFLSALVTRLQIRIDHRNNGIKRVYAPGEHSRTLKKQLAEARAIQLLALSGYGFTHAYRRILTDCVARGGTVEYLLAQPGTAYMKDAAEIEGRGADSISEEVGETLKLLEAIRRDAAEKAGKQKAEPGRVLVRYFHTEMREQLILCTDQSGRRTAWLSLLIPPLPALECNMIEYRDAEDCVDYYEAVKRRSEPCPVAVPGRMHGKDSDTGRGPVLTRLCGGTRWPCTGGPLGHRERCKIGDTVSWPGAGRAASPETAATEGWSCGSPPGRTDSRFGRAAWDIPPISDILRPDTAGAGLCCQCSLFPNGLPP